MTNTISTRCCVVGGGPAGMMAGYLLARAGIDVVVLEKHGDFLRDFRGDTIHPSTLDVMGELGLLEGLLRRPHSEVAHIDGIVGDERVHIADFSHLPTRCKFIAFMPQWDFLDYLANAARDLPTLRLMMNAEATDLIESDGVVRGIRGEAADGQFEIAADLVIAADGRRSCIREAAGLAVESLGAPMDAFWMRLSKQPQDQAATFGRISAGAMFIMLDRGDYWQCALLIRKGSADAIKAHGLDAFRHLLARASDMPAARFAEIDDLDKVKLLAVALDRLKDWAKPGLLCIGDAAHAMSPVGGVGINLAIQDAVAAANILADPLRRGPVDLQTLKRVQARRSFALRATQAAQKMIQERVIGPALDSGSTPKLPLPLRLFNRFPILRRIPARLIGVGIKPEHIHPALLRDAPRS